MAATERPAPAEGEVDAARSHRSTSRARYAAAGIFISKLFGLVRDRVLANYLGTGGFGDVFRAALRAANNLQNLLGDQALSAAFVPIYARLLSQNRKREAGLFAGAVFGLLVAAVSLVALVCVLAAPWVATILAFGFRSAAGATDIDRFALLVRAIRITFPMTAMLVLSAWSLAVLNAHRRFFLSYLAPVMWNSGIVSVLLIAAWRSGLLSHPGDAGPTILEEWLFAGLWGSLLGGAFQFLIQLPLVLRLSQGLRPSVDLNATGVKEALRAFWPALAGRGVVQLSLFVDLTLCSLLKVGAVSGIGFAAGLVNLVMGVFGVSVAAVELPEMSEDGASATELLPARIDRAARQSLFVVAPAVVGYLFFGFLVVVLTYRGGMFGVEANWLVYFVLCAYSLGLPASTVARLMQNAFFALGDTRTPALIALVRLVVSGILGASLMFPLDRIAVSGVSGVASTTNPLFLGGVGLGLASGVGAWFELVLLGRALRSRISSLHLPWQYAIRQGALALAAAVPASVLWFVLVDLSIYLQAFAVLSAYLLAYVGYAWWRRTPELALWVGRRRR